MRTGPSRCRLGWTLIALALLGAFYGCQNREHPRRRPNILLIVIDTLRADRLATYGGERGLTPFLDELAATGTVFEHAYSTSSWTPPAVASLFTSRYPSQHHVVSVQSNLVERDVTLAEVLHQRGYATGAFVGNAILAEEAGYSQGFDHYQIIKPRDHVKPRADEVSQAALQWLDTVWDAKSPTPTLVYLHALDPHGPYNPSEPYRSRFRRNPGNLSGKDVVGRLNEAMVHFMATGEVGNFESFSPLETELLESLYDGEVAAMDASLRTFFDELKRRHFLDGTIILVMADHGERFGEHGGLWHGYTLYNKTIRIPLFIVVPGVEGGRVVAEPVSLIDVLPTLLDLLDAPPVPVFEGRSLASALGKSTPSDQQYPAVEPRDIIVQLEPARDWIDQGQQVRYHNRAIVRDSIKVLTRTSGGSEFYDLKTDPGEREPNRPSISAQAERLAAALAESDAAIAERGRQPAETFEIDEETKQRLRALGYGVDQDRTQ